MYRCLPMLLFIVDLMVKCIIGRDCQDEVTFRSNISMESWCKTDIDSCSLTTMKSTYTTLFNATSWAPEKPKLLNVTSYCQTDSNGHNQAGISITWRLPQHSGARDIKGFELRLEGYEPGYKCSIIKLNENITKSMTQSKIRATIYPVARRKNFIISLFSLPRADDSTIVTYSLQSEKCERHNVSWSSYDVKFGMMYDKDGKELNVSFTRPPDHFNLTEFNMTLIGIKVMYFSEVRINKTFHVFENVDVGKYRIMLFPYNPKPFDEKLCKCRNDRNACITCSNVLKNIGITQKTETKASPTPSRTKTKWTTKVVIKNVTGKKKNKNKKWKKEEKKQTRRVIRVILPVCLSIVCVICITVIIVLCRRRSIQGRFYKTRERADPENRTKPGYLICFEENITYKQDSNRSLIPDCIEIFKGVLGKQVNIQRFGYRHTPDFNDQLLHCLKKMARRGKRGRPVSSSTDRECSETCLVDKKVHGKIAVNVNCCLRNVHKEAVVVICIFGHRSTTVDVFDACQNACDDISNENLECLSICVYPNQTDMPMSLRNSKGFSYKDQLPQVLNYLKDVFLRPRDSSDPKKSEVTFITNGDTDSMKEMDKYVRMSVCKDQEDCWVELPEGIQLSNGPWLEDVKRKRYMSSDSGWGASENSFRSTPIEEEKETSPESSLQFDLESEQDCQSPNKVYQKSYLPRNLSYVHQKLPALPRLQYTHPLLKCPSDISFFPPDELNNSSDNIPIISDCKPTTSDNIHVISDNVHTASDNVLTRSDKVTPTNKQLDEYADNTSLTQVETVVCKNYLDKPLHNKKENRKSASMDTLMDILKDINDQSTYYMEHEAEAGEVHSVFEGTA